MNTKGIYIVQLRKPSPKDPRKDPFWEKGSFGSTGCHASNLMNKKHRRVPNGSRLAFAQGGPDGIRLVLLTPPIQMRVHRKLLEARWNPRFRPFRYESAPILIRPGAGKTNETEFTEIREIIRDTKRKTWPGKFSSRFRSKCHPLRTEAAQQLVTLYSKHKGEKCSDYTQARPSPPEHKMSRLERNKAYNALLKRANRSC